ncbi:MAG: 2Fe-2S iron-sulfur cluster-binding protein [Pseudomonadota bacterium]
MSARLKEQPNEWLNRAKKTAFYFEGTRYEAFEGDTISSALLAAGVKTLARSFKYHRKRGVLSLADHDANVLVESVHEANIRADVTAPQVNRDYRAVNTIGGLKWDLGAMLGWLARALPVGFYYKAFYRPSWAFPYWERLIRRLAGLGTADPRRRSERQSRSYRHCDVLIVGAGPAGLSAALQAAALGLKTVLVDENEHAGGSLSYRDLSDDAQSWRASAVEEIENLELVELLCGATAAGCYDDYLMPIVTAAGVVQIHARSIILATGLIEQPAVFTNNDIPGVMLASGAQRLAHRYAVAPGASCVVLSANDQGYQAAAELQAAGVNVTTIVDTRAAPPMNVAGVTTLTDSYVARANANNGELCSVVIKDNERGTERTIDCDALLMSVGWAPAGSLLRQAGGTLVYDESLQQVVPEHMPARFATAGSINGIFAFDDRRKDGKEAAKFIAAELGLEVTAAAKVLPQSAPQSHPYPIFGATKAFVDFDEDLTPQDLKVGFKEGFDSVELLKRYSTIGMGPSQGKVSNMNGIRELAKLRGEPVGAIGTTTPRPFWQPVPMAKLAGRRLRREWHTPMHEYHLAQGAEMMDTGAWRRPKSYAAGSTREQIEREYQAVRESAGIIDVSTLGKIELFGSGAEALLEHAYTCGFDKLKLGMTRYIFMVDGSGTIVDDGVAARLADNHFYLTATSTHAQTVVRLLQLYADQLALDVNIIDRTTQLGAMNLAGPLSRQILKRITNMDLAEEAFPYLAIREGMVGGVTARLMRVGFVGELGYEIHCEAKHARGLWEAILTAGEAESCRAFGVEAQRLLRLEKGHIIIGQDTDGTTNPFEVNLGWGVKLSKPRFHGRHSLAELKPKVARKLVGFKVDQSVQVEENHLVIEKDDIAGRVTSVAFSPAAQATIGLAFVRLELCEVGSVIQIRIGDGRLIEGTVVATPIYDPDNLRQRIDDPQSLESAA